MGSNTDDLKGRAKEAVGDLIDNDDLKQEGKADRAGGTAKEVIDNVADDAKDLIEDVKNKVQRSHEK